MNALDILYQDEWLVAVNKPAGLLVHRSMIDRHETRFAMQMLRDQIGQHVFPVHRLDKPTSAAPSSETQFHPIVGDTTHGDGKQNTFFRNIVTLLGAFRAMVYP